MATLVYGVMGDSRGHLSRSLAVAGALRQIHPHRVVFAGGGLVASLRDQGEEVIDLPMLETVLVDGKVDGLATLRHTIAQLWRKNATLAAYIRQLERLQPDLLLTDYEFFTPLAARRLGLPCLSIDHQHVATHTRHAPPPGQWWNRQCTSFSIRHLFSHASRYLVSSFFQPPPTDPATVEVFGPVLRPPVLTHSPSPIPGDHFLVYLRGASLPALRQLLASSRRPCRPCHIYGFGALPPEGHLTFKAPSVHGFLEDLTTCAGVLSNGGHSLLSEALHFGKPVCCFPTAMFYEQTLNAHFLQRLGYGLHAPPPHTPAAQSTLAAFEAALPALAAAIPATGFHATPALAARVHAATLGDGAPGAPPPDPRQGG